MQKVFLFLAGIMCVISTAAQDYSESGGASAHSDAIHAFDEYSGSVGGQQLPWWATLILSFIALVVIYRLFYRDEK